MRKVIKCFLCYKFIFGDGNPIKSSVCDDCRETARIMKGGGNPY